MPWKTTAFMRRSATHSPEGGGRRRQRENVGWPARAAGRSCPAGARRRRSRPEDRPALGERARAQQRAAGDRRPPRAARDQQRARGGQAGGGAAELLDRPLVVGAADAAGVQPALHQLRERQLGDRAADGQPPRRLGLGDGRERGQRRPGARRGAGGEQERQLAARLVPDRHRGVGDQRAGVGGQRQPEQRGGDLAPRGRARPQRRSKACARPRRGRGPEAGEDPRADAHRRGDLEHPQHVQEALGHAEVGDQQRRADDRARRARRAHARRASTSFAAQLGQAAPSAGRRAGQPAGEEVDRDLRRPDRLLDDRPAVVRTCGRRGAHRRASTSDRGGERRRRAPAPRRPAARPDRAEVARRCRPGRAAGRRPRARRAAGRTRRSRRRRRRRRRRTAAPRPARRPAAARAARSARSRSSSSSPNWIEFVGHACAQAGSLSSLSRS